MKEHEARRVILKRKDLTDGDKVVMMAILITMDWDQWENRTSSSISKQLRHGDWIELEQHMLYH